MTYILGLSWFAFSQSDLDPVNADKYYNMQFNYLSVYLPQNI